MCFLIGQVSGNFIINPQVSLEATNVPIFIIFLGNRKIKVSSYSTYAFNDCPAKLVIVFQEGTSGSQFVPQ